MPVETIRVTFPRVVRRLLDIPGCQSEPPTGETQASVGSSFYNLFCKRGVLLDAQEGFVKAGRRNPLPHRLYCPLLRGSIGGEYGDLVAELRSNKFDYRSEFYMILLLRDFDHNFCLKQTTTFNIHQTHFNRSDLDPNGSLLSDTIKPEDATDLQLFAEFTDNISARFARIPPRQEFSHR